MNSIATRGDTVLTSSQTAAPKVPHYCITAHVNYYKRNIMNICWRLIVGCFGFTYSRFQYLSFYWGQHCVHTKILYALLITPELSSRCHKISWLIKLRFSKWLQRPIIIINGSQSHFPESGLECPSTQAYRSALKEGKAIMRLRYHQLQIL